MKKETQQENFDQQIKGLFDGFQEVPQSSNWENISNRLDYTDQEREFDNIFKGRFEASEVPPPPEVWENVKKELPLHLIVRTQLSKLSRVAAVLLFGMIAFATYDHFNNSTAAEITVEAPDPFLIKQEEMVEKGINKAVVYQLEYDEEEKLSDENFIEDYTFTSEEEKMQFATKMLEQILASDESDKQVDSLKINKLLEPANNPLNETSFTSLEDEAMMEELEDSNRTQKLPSKEIKAEKK